MNKNKTLMRVLLLASSLLSGHTALAAPYTLLDATRAALTQNPEARARLHALSAAREERGIGEGIRWPQLSLNGSAGYDSSERDSGDLSTSRYGVGLTLTQMLFDGFRTRYEQQKFSYAEWTRYYELLDTAESLSLETARAYFDVQRYRQQVRLAEDNYVQHRAVFEQIRQRVESGVSRRVDLEQAGGRLALAQSNLLTERSNLHDVSTRFQRLVGMLPPEELADAPSLRPSYPATAAEVLARAHQSNPALKAANANVAAARSDVESTRSTRWPTVDLRASSRAGKDESFIDGPRTDNTLELVVNYKLWSGGTDSARTRMFSERRLQAEELRLKACRDMRQIVLIAYNDVQQLQRQLTFLDEHQLAIGKAREAYRQQFNIGQRSLLDLLDSENEYFEARRAYLQGEYDLAFAYVRTQAGAGQLLSTLGLQAPGARPEHESDPAMEVQCPSDGTAVSLSDMTALDARAQALVQSRMPPPPVPTPAPVEVKPQPVVVPIAKKPSKTIEVKADGLFDVNRADLHDEGAYLIDEAVKAAGTSYSELARWPGLTISVVGHSDRTGLAKRNQKLSLARAESTKAYLISSGLAPEQIKTEGRGSSQPKSGKQCLKLKSKKAKAACLAQDRRVELRIYTPKPVDGTKP